MALFFLLIGGCNLKANRVLEWLLWVLLSVFAYAASMLVPLLSPFVILLSSVPFMVLTRKTGLKEAMFGVVFGTAISFSMLGLLPSVMYLLSFGIQGVAFGIASARAKNGFDYLLAAITTSITSKIALMAAFTKIAGRNPFILTQDVAKEVISSIPQALANGVLFSSQEAINNYALKMTEDMGLLLPSMLIMFACLDTLASSAVACRVLTRMKVEKLPEIPDFGHWRFPKNILWALLASLLVDVASKSLPDERLFIVLSVNLMEVLRGVFILEGLSLGWYFMRARGVKLSLRIFVSASCILFSPASYILSMVGIFDIWYDLRKRIGGNKNEGNTKTRRK